MDNNAWADFETVRHNVKQNTVDKLKQILSGLNEECGTHYPKTGKKQELIDRIVGSLDTWRSGNYEDKWTKAKAIIQQVRNTGSYTPSRPHGLSAVMPSSHLSTTYDSSKTHSFASTTVGSSNGIGHYDPYAPARRPSAVSAPVASTSSSLKVQGIRFKDSPFFRVDQTVSTLVECPESTSATDRRQQSLNFALSPEQLSKMKSNPLYQLRLFCTSSIFFAGIGSFRTNALACPIEFPATCEVRVNNTQITANLKGLKKKPGTAPPPDLNKYVRLTGSNKVEMVYVNSQQPVQSKKYYMIVMLVEATTIDNLVVSLRGQRLWPAHEVRQKMIQALSEDDEIQVGPQKMSLRCPLTFMRINTPCRSSKCVHPQCFDATSWYTMMEQTTTWLCPVCEKVLDHKDLIMDGYFDEILRETPESVEDVIVEADGQWHTSDHKYGSPEWKVAHPVISKPSSPSKQAPPPSVAPSCPPTSASTSNDSVKENDKGKNPNVEILILDSDDEDEGRVKRELSPSYASSTNQSFDGTLPPASQASPSPFTQSNADVIDLTLDDSDDEPIVSQAPGKRKALEAELDYPPLPNGNETWKKSRVDPSSRILPQPQPQPQPPSRLVSGNINGVGPLHTPPLHSPTSPSRYPSSFVGNTLPLPYPSYNPTNSSRLGPNNPSLQLPPITNSFISGQGQNPRWGPA